MKLFLTLVLILVFCDVSEAGLEAPVLRAKLSMYSTTVTAGELVKDQPLGSMMTLQPSLLWNIPSMNARMGVHYILDVNSNYGATPISGIGFSGYYYLKGLSSVYEVNADEVLTQKSRPGLFTFASFTPVNFNLNKLDKTDPNQSFSFSALVYEFILGVGYEYPLKQNALLAIELSQREGSSSSGSQNVRYSGMGASIVFTTSYY
ncbi:MAG: hypothetical protein J7501_06030 [Bdellovibrio sp.]|nr:hypothetical protein [Bdellovibrio sp.]